MGSYKRYHVRLSAIDQLALRLAFIDTVEGKISEERIAQCFNVCRLTVRNLAIRQGLRRGLIGTQMNRLRQLYETVVGAAGSDADWTATVERAQHILAVRLERAFTRRRAVLENVRAVA